MITGIDPPPGEDHRPSGEHHGFRTLHHQQFGLAIAGGTEDDESGSGNRGWQIVIHTIDLTVLDEECHAAPQQSTSRRCTIETDRGWVVEPRGIEPLTSAVRLQRSPI